MFNMFVISALLTGTNHSPHECNQEIHLSLKTSNKYFEVYYDLPKSITDIQIDFPTSLKDIISGNISKGTGVEKTIIREDIESRKYKIKINHLTRIENTTYAPYIHTEKSNVIYIPYILPMKIKNESGEWIEVSKNCISLNINGRKIPPLYLDEFYVDSQKQKTTDAPSDSQLNFHFSTNTPKWIQALVINKTKINYDFLTEKIGKIHRKTDVVVAFYDTKSAFYDGGVSGNTLVIRFGGAPWQHFDSAAATQITKFVAHEVFHFWNQPDSTLPSWFHEGSAEYAANYVTAISEFKFNSDNELKKLECMLLHGGSSAHVTPGWSARYKCGQSFWAGLFKDPTDFFNFWRKKYNRPAESDLDFLFNNVPTAMKNNLVDLIDPMTSKTQRYGSYLNLIGNIKLSKNASQPYMKGIALQHLMASNCDGTVSFSEHFNYVNFYHQENCKSSFSQPLPLIYKVNKLALDGDPYELLRSVLTSCGQLNQALLSAEGDSEVISIACPISAQLVARIAFEST